MADSGGPPAAKPPIHPGSLATRPAEPTTADLAPEPEVLDKAAEILRPLLRDPGKATQAVARVVAVAESFSGPVPHPKHFKGYEEVVPGSAREILDMAKAEQRHRHQMQWLEMIYPYLGWFAGFIGLLGCIAAATYLAMNNHEGVAGGMLGVPSLGVLGWFIRARLAASGDQEPAAPASAKPGAARSGRRKR